MYLVAQSCLALNDPMDCSPPGSSVHGDSPMNILQARILEWVVMRSFRGSYQPRGSNPGLWHCRRILYRSATREAQEYWNGKCIPSPGDLPQLRIEPRSSALQEGSLSAELPGKLEMYKIFFLPKMHVNVMSYIIKRPFRNSFLNFSWTKAISVLFGLSFL